MNEISDRQELADALFAEALVQIEKKEFALGVERLEEAVKLAPRSPDIYWKLVDCYEALDQLRNAIRALTEVLLLSPTDVQAAKKLEELHHRRVGKQIHHDFTQTSDPPSWPTISLCMIVKNEEANLAACLDSVKDLVSEIIVVDTGSNDRTVEIARSYGARVEYFAWVDDFAAARNEALKYASKEWVLVLDADDRVEPLQKIRLKWAAFSGLAQAYVLFTHNLKPDGREESVPGFVRLFRNLPGIKYVNPLHETISQELINQGITICSANIQIDHWGYLITSEEMRKKTDRNLRILTQAVEKNPDDYFCKIVRYLILLNREPDEKLISEVELALHSLPDRFIPTIYLGEIYVYLLKYYSRTNQVEKSRWIIDQSILDMLIVRAYWVYAGFCLLTPVGDGTRALQVLLRASTMPASMPGEIFFDKEFQKTFLSNRFLARLLMRSYLMTNQFALANRIYLDKLANPPKGVVLASKQKLAQAEESLRSGQYLEAVKLLSPTHPKDNRALRLLALAEAMLESWERAAEHYTAAVALTGPQPGDWTTLAACEMRNGNVGLARSYARQALNANPQDATAREVLSNVEKESH